MSKESLSIDGIVYTYELHIPNNLLTTPDLVIALHGGGSNGQEMWKRNWARQANKGFIIACPTARSINKPTIAEDHWVGLGDEKYGPSLDVHAHERFIEQIIYRLEREYQVRNTYVCGFSSGAKMSFHMACHNRGHIKGFGMTGHGINDQLAARGIADPQPTRFSIGTIDPNFHTPEVGWDAFDTYDWLREELITEGTPIRTTFTGRSTISKNRTFTERTPLQIARLQGMSHRWAKETKGDPYYEDDALVKFWKDYAGMRTA